MRSKKFLTILMAVGWGVLVMSCSQTDTKKPKDEITYKIERRPKPAPPEDLTRSSEPKAGEKFKYLELTDAQLEQAKTPSGQWSEADLDRYVLACQNDVDGENASKSQCICMANYLSHLTEVPVDTVDNGYLVTLKSEGIVAFCQARALDPLYAGRAGFWRVAMRQRAQLRCTESGLEPCECLVGQLSQALHFADFLHLASSGPGDLQAEFDAVASRCP